ncbi:sensor histidine kinase [Methylobrevis pamukkalensis]|uniref:Nitrate/nitrite sensor protein NarX n=1 Tax=Methylobrevis pamukkalensis TaxID=1439726 RepID=A0A1E3GWD9_9HYPH|nr:ATP-binding protein [Methylobrevis pamukkalensis]ODN68367.1 Nitrate/nitrite sensor protein NarX [Methylobrevis pamukkalensis]
MRVTQQMMTTLKGALARLRPPDVDDLGLDGCLADLVSRWNALGRGRALVHLHVHGEIGDVPRETAVNVYRIAQECITNAARHGAPGRRTVDLHLRAEPDGTVRLTVEDDGGGDPATVETGGGFGVIGIRERLASIGGALQVGRTTTGLSVSARVPPLGLRIGGLAA